MLFTQLLAQTDDAGAMAAIAGMGMLSNVIGLALFVFIGFCQFTIAKRVGLENPWFAFIPILNIYQMTLLAGKDWWWLLLCLVPCVNIVAVVILMMGVAEAGGKPSWWGILMFLPCTNLIAWPYVAFSK